MVYLGPKICRSLATSLSRNAEEAASAGSADEDITADLRVGLPKSELLVAVRVQCGLSVRLCCRVVNNDGGKKERK